MHADGRADLEQLHIPNAAVLLQIRKQHFPKRKGLFMIIAVTDIESIIIRVLPDFFEMFSAQGNQRFLSLLTVSIYPRRENLSFIQDD